MTNIRINHKELEAFLGLRIPNIMICRCYPLTRPKWKLEGPVHHKPFNNTENGPISPVLHTPYYAEYGGGGCFVKLTRRTLGLLRFLALHRGQG